MSRRDLRPAPSALRIGVVAFALAVLAAPDALAQARSQARSQAQSTTARHVERMARTLDGDAPIAIRVDAAAAQSLLAAARRDAPGRVKATLALISAGARFKLGFDPLSAAGWAAAGLDTNMPVLATGFALDAAEIDRHEAAVERKPDAQPRALWRFRAVARVARWDRAERAIAAILAETRAGVIVPRGPDRDRADRIEPIAALLGARRAQVVARALRKRGVIAVGRVPAPQGQGSTADGLWFVDRRADLLRVTVLMSRAGAALVWQRDSSAILAHLDPLPQHRQLATALDPFETAELVRPGVAARIDPEVLLSVYVSEQRALLGADSSGTALATCQLHSAAMPESAFRSLIVRLQPARASIDLELLWFQRQRGAIGTYIGRVDRGLRLPARPDTALAGILYLSNLKDFAALPRSTPLNVSLRSMLIHFNECGDLGTAALAIAAWPQLLGSWIARFADVGDDYATSARAVGNVAFAFRALHPDPRQLDGAVEVSVAAAGAPIARRMFDAVFGPGDPRGAAVADGVQYWGVGRVRPFARPLDGGAYGMGLATGVATRDWYLAPLLADEPADKPAPPTPRAKRPAPRAKRPAPRRRLQSAPPTLNRPRGSLGVVTADAGALIRQLQGPIAAIRAVTDVVGNPLGAARGTLDVDAHTLRLSVTVHLR